MDKAIRLVLFVLLAAYMVNAQSAYDLSVQRWRVERENKLKADLGWLSVTGLFWLEEGINKIGTAPQNDIVLPSSTAPATVGEIVLREGRSTFRAAEGAQVTSRGSRVTALEVKSNSTNDPDLLLQVGSLTFGIIKRGTRYGVRVWDTRSAYRQNFTGLKWYDVDERYRVVATLVPFDQPTEIRVTNILGDVERMKSPGTLVFTLGGEEYRLQPVLDQEEDKLFILFRDLTSGRTTYGAGRFLYADPPQDGKVVLDFNRAYSPPCAFTAYATCPLPPAQNRLKTHIAAGEKADHRQATPAPVAK